MVVGLILLIISGFAVCGDTSIICHKKGSTVSDVNYRHSDFPFRCRSCGKGTTAENFAMGVPQLWKPNTMYCRNIFDAEGNACANGTTATMEEVMARPRYAGFHCEYCGKDNKLPEDRTFNPAWKEYEKWLGARDLNKNKRVVQDGNILEGINIKAR